MSKVRSAREEYANYYRQSQSRIPHGRLYQPRDGAFQSVPKLVPTGLRLGANARAAGGCRAACLLTNDRALVDRQADTLRTQSEGRAPPQWR
jgi:hypothetical protein